MRNHIIGNRNTLKIGTGKIKSVKRIVDKRHVCSHKYSKLPGVERFSVVYDSNTIVDDLKKYGAYLESEGFVVDASNPMLFTRRNVNGGCESVTMQERTNGYQLTLESRVSA